MCVRVCVCVGGGGGKKGVKGGSGHSLGEEASSIEVTVVNSTHSAVILLRSQRLRSLATRMPRMPVCVCECVCVAYVQCDTNVLNVYANVYLVPEDRRRLVWTRALPPLLPPRVRQFSSEPFAYSRRETQPKLDLQSSCMTFVPYSPWMTSREYSWLGGSWLQRDTRLMAGARRCVSARQLALLLWKNSILKRRSYLGTRIPVNLSVCAVLHVLRTSSTLRHYMYIYSR